VFRIALALLFALAVAVPAAAQEPELSALVHQEADARALQDAVIASHLEEMFAFVDEFAEVEVEVRAGVVRLTGETPQAESRRGAEELAAEVPGVLYVDNAIVGPTEVSKRISPAIRALQDWVRASAERLPLLLVSALVLIVFWVASRVLVRWDLPWRGLRDRPLLQGIARQAASTVVLLVGVLIVLELLDITALVGALLGTAGVIGIAVGFAFKDIVENYLASLILSVRQPFSKNDLVQIGSHQGKVVRLNLRETVLMTLDGNHLRIPNAEVFKSVVTNYTRNPLRRFDFGIGIGSGEDLARVLAIGREALGRVPGVLTDPGPTVLVEGLGDFAVDVHLYAWVDQGRHGFAAVQSEAIRRVKEAYDGAGVDMPEPTQRVHLREAAPMEQPAPEPVGVEATEPTPVDLGTTDAVDEQIAHDREVAEEPDLLE
jgi:small-conductance mechanosensitive channel